MVIGAVSQLLEHVIGLYEWRLADPGDPLPPHLGVGRYPAIHPCRHVVAADTCIPAAALRHPGGCVVRAARAEIRNPGDWKWHELAVRLLSSVEKGHSLRNR